MICKYNLWYTSTEEEEDNNDIIWSWDSPFSNLSLGLTVSWKWVFKYKYHSEKACCYMFNTQLLCWNPETQTAQYKLVQHISDHDYLCIYPEGYRRVQRQIVGLTDNDPDSTPWYEKIYVLYAYKMAPNLRDDLYVTGQHSIIVSEEEFKLYARPNHPVLQLENHPDKYFLMAACTRNLFRQVSENYTSSPFYFHFVLEDDQPHGIWANGILSESTCSDYLDRFVMS